MANDLEMIHDQMEETRTSLADKLEALEVQVLKPVEAVSAAVTSTAESVQETIETVRETLDFRHHVEQRPWFMMGGAVAVGFIGDRVLGKSTAAAAIPVSAGQNGYHATNGAAQSQAAESASGTAGGAIGKLFHKLQQNAVGTLMGTVKDFVLRFLPDNVSADAAHIVDDLTVRFGGLPQTNSETAPASPQE